MNEDEKYMRRAIELAEKGIGRHSPNPMVGCVIVRDGEIVGEGYHIFEKVKHAETIALEAAGDKARDATVYVTVEPCCHTGRTPPCTDALILSGVRKVVYGMTDPDPRVCGGGRSSLEDAGIEVVGEILENEIRDQNKFFITATEKNRPYILLKWAMTLDGKIATRTGASRWISGEKSRNLVHHLRNIYQSILVGHNTVLVDDPHLTCRFDRSPASCPEGFRLDFPKDIRHPVSVVIDMLGATSGMSDLNIFKSPGAAIIAVGPETGWEDSRSRDSLEHAASAVIECPLDGGHLDLSFIMKTLVGLGIHSCLVEGGSGIHAAFLESGLADEIMVTVAPKIFGSDTAPSPVAGSGVDMVDDAWTIEKVEHLRIDDDLIITGRIKYKSEDE